MSDAFAQEIRELARVQARLNELVRFWEPSLGKLSEAQKRWVIGVMDEQWRLSELITGLNRLGYMPGEGK